MAAPLGLKDLVKIVYDEKYRTRRIEVPTVCVCKCGGAISLYVGWPHDKPDRPFNMDERGSINDPDLAFQVSLINHGRMMERYDNGPPTKCECKAKLDAARKLMEGVAMIRDTKWNYTRQANPRRGYHDYERTVEFDRPLTDAEEEAFSLIAYRDGPGAQTFSCTKSPTDPKVYNLRTMCDSGD